MVVVALVKALI